MTPSDKLRKIAEKYKTGGYRIVNDYAGNKTMQRYDNENELLSDLTALISEHYTANEEVDKMVEERLREELIKYDKYIGSRGWIDNYEDWAAITSVDEYLKSREDSK
jgi:hypothetical protein